MPLPQRSVLVLLLALASSFIFVTPTLAVDPSQLFTEITHSAGAAPATDRLRVVQHGDTVVTSTGAINLALPAGKVINASEGSIVAGKGAAEVIFQKVGKSGFRASVHIAEPTDPERYNFTVIGADRLQQLPDKSVLAFDHNGEPLSRIAPPWAKDAKGLDVPTHYEIAGTTLVQVVEHNNRGFTYGITADPFWVSLWDATRCVAALVVAYAPMSQAFNAISSLGGPESTLNRIRESATMEEFSRLAGEAAVWILAVDGVQNYCF